VRHVVDDSLLLHLPVCDAGQEHAQASGFLNNLPAADRQTVEGRMKDDRVHRHLGSGR
jgi:hypothetical protein